MRKVEKENCILEPAFKISLVALQWKKELRKISEKKFATLGGQF